MTAAAVFGPGAGAASAAARQVSGAPQASVAHGSGWTLPIDRPRTVITTDGEQDDENSFIHYLTYANEFNTVGIIYSDSQWHWAGDGKGTVFDGFGGPTTSFRWDGTTWIQQLVGLYGQEYPDFKSHDPGYPTPQQLLSTVRIGNIDFPGEMTQDTPGSDLIKKLLLDD